ncbi:MAG: ATP-binding protein [Myxococcota bacterium]
MDALIVSILGPESSGKSTLVSALGKAFGGTVVPEAARTFYERHPRTPAPEDIVAIAADQASTMRAATGTVFFDTDPRSTAVWSEMLWGSVPEELSVLSYPSPALTLLCRPDLPWVYEPLRVHSELSVREDFFRRLRQRVTGHSVIVEGADRFALAAAAVQALTQRSPSF